MAPVIPKPKNYSDFSWDKYDDWSSNRVEIMEQIAKAKAMGIGEAAQAAPTQKEYISIRVEPIENGFLVKYSGPGAPERIRYAQSLTAVGEQIVAAAVEMKLRGAEAK